MIPRRLRVVRGFIVSCALGLAATGLALFILEGATRLIGWHGPALTASSEGDRGLWAYDATKGWFHRPFQSGRVDLGGPDAGRVRINSWGFRGPEPVAAPSRGQRRVLVFGDSFVFGIGVDEEHLFTAHLKRFLDRAGLEHEVINAGVSGYSTDQELILFSELGPKLSPDFVVLVACDNDFAGNTEDFAYQRYPKPYFDLAPDGELILRNSPVPELRAAQRVKLWLGQHSNLWNLVRNRRSDFPALQSGLNGFEVGIARPNSTDRVALTFALVRAFHTLAQRLGAGFVLVNTGHRGEQTPLFHALRGRMRRAGLPFLGLEAALGEARRAHPTGTWDFPKDTHWNLDAHRLAAQQVANFIRSVPPPAP